MAASARILNTSTGHLLKRSKVARLFAQCAVAWDEPGVSIRNLTVAEMVKARAQQKQSLEPPPWAELPGYRFDPPESGMAATLLEGRLVKEANEFIMRGSAPAPFLKFERPQTARPTPDRESLVA